MAEKNILHMVTPAKHASPFDVNMALDAGYDAVLTYTNVALEDVTGLVQDSIFSRPPKVGARTAMFFGGKNAGLALDMLEKARKSAGAAIWHFVFRRPRRFIHNRRRHGGVRRESAEGQEEA